MRAHAAVLASSVALAIVAVVGLAGCSALSSLKLPGAAAAAGPSPAAGPPVILLPSPVKPSSATPVTKTLTAAISGCALTATSPGVYLAPNGRTLVLSSESGGRPSGIDANDVRCIFTHLKMPSAEVKLLESSLIWGGLQTASWSDLSARWLARSTSRLTASVYVVG